MEKCKLRLLATACIATLIGSEAAQAQFSQPVTSSEVPEIIVTARKRQESILNVPAVEIAVSQQTLDKLQVSTVGDLTKLVPGLGLGKSLLSIGSLVSIRGVGTSSQDPGVDQSVALNIDGMALGQGLAFQTGMFDVGQVEVLKGPQALFYGKASPGGVISLRTADPTSRNEIIARAGYDFEAREKRGELILSGPITDSLKARLSTMYAAADGYFINQAQAIPGTGGVNPYTREPRPHTFFLRGTLLWNPTDNFSARLKFNYAHDRSINGGDSGQLANCPQGGSFAPGGIAFLNGDNCKLDRYLRIVYLDPNFFPGVMNNGVPFLTISQKFGTLELNYKVTPHLTLTSTTGIYDLGSHSMVNTGRPNPPVFAVENGLKRRDFTEELRLNSEFEGPLNFTAGGFYQDGRLTDHLTFIGNSYLRLPARLTDGQTSIDILTKSFFGQARWQIVPQVELAAGARWTDERRNEVVSNYLTGVLQVPVRTPVLHSKTTAPEVTLTYRPTGDLTLFAAYKQGNKSGSFTIATLAAANADNSFGDEKVKGWEAGLKSRLLDHRLLLNLAFYDYRYNGLQVGAADQPVGGVPVIRTINAGAARTYGIDFDATWKPEQVQGLALNLAANWDKARYDRLNNVPCWGGQLISEGCTGNLNPVTGRFTTQNANGTPLVRAPEWQATFGFDYEMPIGQDMKLALGNSNLYSSKYATFIAVNRPNNDNFMGANLKMDLSLALRGADDRWEIAVIGKNVTDKITSGLCSPTFYSSGQILNTAGQISGTTSRGSAGISEAACYTDSGRAVWLRLTFRPLAERD